MSSSSQMFNLALQYHQAGNLAQAETLYRQILEVDPRHVNSLHLFGVLAFQVGRNDLAVDYIQQAVRLHPDYPMAYNNLGKAWHNLGKLEDAVESFRQALRLKPDFAEACNNLGNALRAQGKLEEAAASYRQAVRCQPDFADGYANLGNVLRELGKLEEAILNCREALRLKPTMAEAHNHLGIALFDHGQVEEAIAVFGQATLLKPDFAEAHSNLSNALRIQGRVDEAISHSRQAVRLKPDYADLHNNLGNALKVGGRFDEAVSSYRQALRLNSGHAIAWSNLGKALREQDKIDEAIASYRQALRLKPDDADAYSNLGVALRERQEVDEAIACTREAVRLSPNFADAHVNLATYLLLRGDFADGWKEYDWRWQGSLREPIFSPISRPLWQGNPLPEGTILLCAEQGQGDMLQFIRYAQLVKQRVGTVLCICQASLARLLTSCAGLDRIIPLGESIPESAFDVYAPLLSLPGIFETRLETIPGQVPYLHAGAALKESQALALANVAGFKIGITWQGDPRKWNIDFRRADQRRSIPLAQFEPLAHVPGVQLFSLQKGFGSEQIEELADRFPLFDLGSTCEDFYDTAVVMKNLDLVISVDSAPAHLAGALGVPVWVALPSVNCWRWLTKGEDSLWYPTMRLFRQTSPGNWTDVFERMAIALRERIAASQVD